MPDTVTVAFMDRKPDVDHTEGKKFNLFSFTVGLTVGLVLMFYFPRDSEMSTLGETVQTPESSNNLISQGVFKEIKSATLKGDSNSEKFSLTSGSYKVDYTPIDGARPCQPQAHLVPVASPSDKIEMFDLGSQGEGPGTNYLYGIEEGTYFIETSWTFGCTVEIVLFQEMQT